jgi:hypothetical protein
MSENTKDLQEIKDRLQSNYSSHIMNKKTESKDTNFLEKIDKLYNKIYA